MELPELTVGSRHTDYRRHDFGLSRRVGLCRGCPDCRITDDPLNRWEVDLMRIEEEGEIGILPAMIVSLRNGKINLHCRHLQP